MATHEGPTEKPIPLDAGGTPTVSVIIAAYNAAVHVGGAINALLAQTVKNIEILVVDDCSKDSTSDIVSRLAESDPRIRLIRRDGNGGPGPARNSGLDVARGEWISVVDADDGLDPRRLETMLALADRHGADMLADNQWLVDGGSGANFDLMFPPSHLDQPKVVTAPDFVRNNRPSSVKRKYGLLKPLIRKDFLDRNGIRYRDAYLGEDFLFYLECLIRGARFVLVPEAFYFYQLSRGTLSQTRSLIHADEFIRNCENLMGRADVQAIPGLVEALRDRSAELRSDFVYLQFAQAIKRRHFATLLKVVWKSPQLLPYVAGQGLRVGKLRLLQGFRRPERGRPATENGYLKSRSPNALDAGGAGK